MWAPLFNSDDINCDRDIRRGGQASDSGPLVGKTIINFFLEMWNYLYLILMIFIVIGIYVEGGRLVGLWTVRSIGFWTKL